MLGLLSVKDNERLNRATKIGLEATRQVRVAYDCDSRETAPAYCLEQPHLPAGVVTRDQMAVYVQQAFAPPM